MIKPKTIVLSGYGLNCEEETKYAFELAGAKADIVHINDIIANYYQLKNYQIMAIPGGFAYGDDTGSGNAYAQKLKNHLWNELTKFVSKDNLVIGICNGFQILVNLGLLGRKLVALVHNDNARYTVRWVDLKIENDSPWLDNIKEISLPIAHGEGKFFASPKTIQKLIKNNQVAARYEANPNGSLDNVAAITDKSGKILGIMPHPERAIFFTQLPNWPYLKEKYQRENKKLPTFADGLQIFKNAIKYFK